MGRLSRFLSSSIGQKQLMAITGLIWTGFLIGHLSGNFLLFAGAEKFNAYAEFVSSQVWLIPGELFLVGVLVTHMFLAIRLTTRNRAARASTYVAKSASDATLASRTMIFSGLLVFIFLVLHLIHFKYGGYQDHVDGLYGLVMERFSQPWFSIMYVLFMVVLGFHLVHAIQSVIQTFGWNHPVYMRSIKVICVALALILTIGFSSLPLWAWLIEKGGA